MRYFLRLAYNGSPFHGWQRQPNAVSVQQTLEDALSIMLRHEVEIVGAGRTDTGVHASEMFAHLDIDPVKDKTKFITSLNRLIGKDIAIYDLHDVIPTAHARFDAVKRTYEYIIHLEKNPFSYGFSHFMNRLPDIGLMNEAARMLLTTEDFTSFAKLHSNAKTNVCKVVYAGWDLDEANKRLTFTISADRFLRNMVRSVVGTLLDVGLGKLTLSNLEEIIEAKDRCAASVSMPAQGLFLKKIEYPKEIFL